MSQPSPEYSPFQIFLALAIFPLSMIGIPILIFLVRALFGDSP